MDERIARPELLAGSTPAVDLGGEEEDPGGMSAPGLPDFGILPDMGGLEKFIF